MDLEHDKVRKTRPAPVITGRRVCGVGLGVVLGGICILWPTLLPAVALAVAASDLLLKLGRRE